MKFELTLLAALCGAAALLLSQPEPVSSGARSDGRRALLNSGWLLRPAGTADRARHLPDVEPVDAGREVPDRAAGRLPSPSVTSTTSRRWLKSTARVPRCVARHGVHAERQADALCRRRFARRSTSTR